MKIAVALCVLAFIACASADCGCLRCNPHFQVVSPKSSPCKVIYRNKGLNLPTTAPYKLQAAVPPPPPTLIVPKEYDYKMQYFPLATPYVGSVYEYGLQAAVPPPPGPLHIPFKNLRTGVERVVMDAPINAVLCGTSHCHSGVPRTLPLPAPLVPVSIHHHHDCGCKSGCNSCSCGHSCDCVSTRRNPYGFDTYELETNEDDCEKMDRETAEDLDEERLPTIERLEQPICRRYALNSLRNLQYSDNCLTLKNKRKSRNKRDIIDLPMNFMFKFVPNLLRGPIVHAIHTIQHNANPAVAMSKAIANKHRIQAHLAKSKQKIKALQRRHKISKNSHSSHRHQSIPRNENDYINKFPQKSRLKQFKPKTRNNRNELSSTNIYGQPSTKSRENSLTYDSSILPKFFNRKLSNRLKPNDKENKDLAYLRPNNYLGTKYSNDEKTKFGIGNHRFGRTNNFFEDLFNVFEAKPREHTASSHKHQRFQDELKKHLHEKGYSDANLRDILLAKMQKFNEIYEKDHSKSYLNKLKSNRKKRSVVLDTNQFQLPFYEIEDEVLDNYDDDSEQKIVGMKRNRRKKLRKQKEGYNIGSGEEILGASHPLYDHPFVVLLKTPLKLLHHFHDIRKNFQPILYSLPKIFQSSKRYLKDFGRNLQSGILDFTSNIMGDFNNQLPLKYDSIFFPTRKRRSVDNRMMNLTDNPHNREKRYILKVVDEKEVQDFLEEKLGGYFSDEEESEETLSKAEKSTKKREEKFIVKKLSPKLILDNNGKPFIEINGNKRPLFFGKNKQKSALLQKSKNKTHRRISADSEERPEKEYEDENNHEEVNDKIDKIISQAKRKLKEGETLRSMNCDEIPTQTIKEKINQISVYIQDLVSLDCSKYADLFENLSKLEKMRKNIADYWKKVMINEKTNDIQCKIKILKNIREMQDEKDEATKKIAEYLKKESTFVVKKLIKLLVRLQKLQCLIQKIVDHFDNRMKIGTISDTEKEIKFVDYLSSLSLEASQSEDDFVRSLKKEKHESLHKEIQFLENLRLLLQKDDPYTTNEVAKQIWQMRNVDKLQQEAIDEMHVKLQSNMKIRKELKILFDLLHQIEISESTCERLLLKVGDSNIVGAKYTFKHGKRQLDRPSLAELLERIRNNAKKTIGASKLLKRN